jgi:hypothetical protein
MDMMDHASALPTCPTATTTEAASLFTIGLKVTHTTSRRSRIYLASRFSKLKMMRTIAVRLEDLGHTVTSRWIWRTDTNIEDLTSDDAAIVAREDLEDVIAADCLILFAETPRTTPTRHGRLVEFGAALALGKTIYTVGGPENVFGTLVRNFENWQSLDRYLVSAQRKRKHYERTHQTAL